MTESVQEPGVLSRVDLESAPPTPEGCLPPGEEPVATAELGPGWIAATERELVTYHPDRDPAVTRVPRPNVTGLVVRRAGGRRLLGYVPIAVMAAIGAVVVGLLLLSVDPMQFVTVPDAPGVDSMIALVQTLGWAMNLLGSVLVFGGILVVLVGITVVGYWFVSRDVLLVLERGTADPILCPTTRAAGQRAIQTLEEALAE